MDNWGYLCGRTNALRPHALPSLLSDAEAMPRSNVPDAAAGAEIDVHVQRSRAQAKSRRRPTRKQRPIGQCMLLRQLQPAVLMLAN